MKFDEATMARIAAEHKQIIESNPAMQHEWYIHSVGHRLRADMTENERSELLAGLEVPLYEPDQRRRIDQATTHLVEALRNLDACRAAH
jgi:hypothetical protein